jgi:hypothetical protein
VADSRSRTNIDASLEGDADDRRPESSTVTRDPEALIDRSLAPTLARQPRTLKRWSLKAGHIARASRVSDNLVDATLSVFGLAVVIMVTVSVVIMIAIVEFRMSLFQAALPAACAGLLSPVVVVVLIRLIDLMIRLGFLLIIAALVTGLIEVARQVFFDR